MALFMDRHDVPGISAEEVAQAHLTDIRFESTYGVTVTDGPMAGLLSRAVVVVDGDGVVTYTEQVPEIAQEPNYDAALAALGCACTW